MSQYATRPSLDVSNLSLELDQLTKTLRKSKKNIEKLNEDLRKANHENSLIKLKIKELNKIYRDLALFQKKADEPTPRCRDMFEMFLSGYHLGTIAQRHDITKENVRNHIFLFFEKMQTRKDVLESLHWRSVIFDLGYCPKCGCYIGTREEAIEHNVTKHERETKIDKNDKAQIEYLKVKELRKLNGNKEPVIQLEKWKF